MRARVCACVCPPGNTLPLLPSLPEQSLVPAPGSCTPPQQIPFQRPQAESYTHPRPLHQAPGKALPPLMSWCSHAPCKRVPLAPSACSPLPLRSAGSPGALSQFPGTLSWLPQLPPAPSASSPSTLSQFPRRPQPVAPRTDLVVALPRLRDPHRDDAASVPQPHVAVLQGLEPINQSINH